MKLTTRVLLLSTAFFALTGCTIEEHRHGPRYGYYDGYYHDRYYDDGYYGGYHHHVGSTVVVEPRASVYRRDVYVAHSDVRRSNHVVVRSNAPVYRRPNVSATVVVTDKKKKKHYDHD